MDMVEEVFSYDAMYHPASCPSKGLNLTRIYIYQILPFRRFF